MLLSEIGARDHRRDCETAFEQWSNVVGRQFVDYSPQACDVWGKSTSPWSQRPLGVVRPASLAQVQDVVRIAAAHHVAIYPISGGKNWGLGDACPPAPGQVILDLGRLRAIREVNEPLGYAVIEAGVTQQQLYDELACQAPSLMLDSTGAGPDATIVGNIMERGFGHSPYADRFHHSCNYEVVLPSGEVLRTGFGQFPNAKCAHLLKTGLGPSLDGLFTQSNFGIVTAMTVWLMPKPERAEAFAFKVHDERELGAVVDALRQLRLAGIAPSTVHIANDLRLISSKMTYPYQETGGKTPLSGRLRKQLRQKLGIGAWNVLGGLYGSGALMRGLRAEVCKALRGIATVRFVNDRRLRVARRMMAVAQPLGLFSGFAKQLESIEHAFDLLKGKPVAEHLRGAAWRRRTPLSQSTPQDPLQRGDGLVWLSPTLPMEGSEAETVAHLASEVLESYGFDPLMTFVSISGRAMCCPTTICYDKQDARQSDMAKLCYKELYSRMVEKGYFPYRLGLQSMADFANRSSPHAALNGAIRAAIGAGATIAPGRYGD